jgi:hypothetical protein
MIISYLPEFLQVIKEYIETCKTIDIEFGNLRAGINSVENEVIVDNATEYGLARYEKIFGITPTGNIEERRLEIKLKMINQLPYTYRWLDNKLNVLFGEGNYKLGIDYSNYLLTVEIDYKFDTVAKAFYIDLRQQIPANMILNDRLYENEGMNMYIAGNVHIVDHMTIKMEG